MSTLHNRQKKTDHNLVIWRKEEILNPVYTELYIYIYIVYIYMYIHTHTRIYRALKYFAFSIIKFNSNFRDDKLCSECDPVTIAF